MRHFSLSLCALLLSVAMSAPIRGDEPESKKSIEAPRKSSTVALIVDYGDGAQTHFPEIPWKDGMTVNDVLEFAAKHRHGISFKARGKGATALLYRIDDLENEGGSGLNWIFRVNGKLGDRSFAITPLADGDRILWKFDEYR